MTGQSAERESFGGVVVKDDPMSMQILDAGRDLGKGYRVDASRGQRIGRVSSEWFSRPGDERFLSLGDLARSVRARSVRRRTRVVRTAQIHVEASRSEPERLSLILPGAAEPVAPTHWSFGQLASQVGAPAAYLRELPAALRVERKRMLDASRDEQCRIDAENAERFRQEERRQSRDEAESM